MRVNNGMLNIAGNPEVPCPLPFAGSCPSIPGYSFFKGKGSNGGDGPTKYPGKSAGELASLCSANAACVAFTTNGLLKTAVKSKLDGWSAGACDGIYLRGPEWRLQPAFQLGAAMPPAGNAGRLEVKYGGIWCACWGAGDCISC